MGEGRGGEFRGTARLVASEGAVKGPRFHVNVRAYYYEFRNNGTRAWKLRSACYSFSLFLSVSLPRMEKLNKPRLPRNDQSGGKKELGLGLFCRAADILYLDAYSTKGKNRSLFARSLRRLISSRRGEDLWRKRLPWIRFVIQSYQRERYIMR